MYGRAGFSKIHPSAGHKREREDKKEAHRPGQIEREASASQRQDTTTAECKQHIRHVSNHIRHVLKIIRPDQEKGGSTHIISL